jgi:hypothetical protein
MGLSNPDRASATSIYTHVSRLFIRRYAHALHVFLTLRVTIPPASISRSCWINIFSLMPVTRRRNSPNRAGVVREMPRMIGFHLPSDNGQRRFDAASVRSSPHRSPPLAASGAGLLTKR